MFTFGRSFINLFLPLYIPFLKALKHSQATFLIENLKLQGNFHSGIDEHTCTCSLYLINFHTALFQNLIIMHYPIYLTQKVVHITWLGLMHIMFVFWSLPKKKFFIKYKYSVNYNICNCSITGTYYVDHIF